MVKHRGDDICGVLLLDKPTGRSSNFYLQRLKFLFNAKKAGHTGSLDPLATGLLPICFGKATCISEYFLHSEKSYEAVIQFGVTTDSHDCDGEVVATNEVNFTEQQFESSLEIFTGEIEQIPPMVSALKHNGQPLYKLALKGKEVERKARKMTVYSLTGELLTDNKARLKVHCSSGFYVRQLAADIGET
jgi:tRNA pseudouridine55 synthase